MSSKIFSLSTWLEAQFSVTGVSQDIPGNKTTYTINFHVRRKNTESFQYADDVTYKATGPGLNLNTTIYKSWTTVSSSWVLYYTQKVTVTHNTNGAPPTTSWTFSLVSPSSGWSGSSSMTYALPTIARASSFTLSGATQTNASINVSIARKSSTFTHSVRWRVGSGSWIGVGSGIGHTTSFTVQPGNMYNLKSATITVGVQTYNGTTAIGSEATATRTITIPNTTISISGTASTGSAQTVSITNSGGSLSYTRSWKLGSATGGNVASWTPPHSALPSATSGTLTCTVVTKNGTATINTVSATRTITVPTSVLPTFSSITHSEYVSTVSTKVGAYVQGRTRLTLGVTSPVAGSGSSIKSYSISVAGHTVGNGGTTPVITQGGTLTISATITDNRNRTATKTATIAVLVYENPIITGVSFTRSNSDGTPNTTGTYLTIKATIRVRRLVVGGVEKNGIWYQSHSGRVGYSYVTKTDLENQAGTINGNYRQSVYTHTFSGYPVDYAYNVRVRGGDTFSWSGFIAGGIPTGVVLQHWGEDTTAFGKMIDDVNYNVLVGSKGLKSDGPILVNKRSRLEIDHDINLDYLKAINGDPNAWNRYDYQQLFLHNDNNALHIMVDGVTNARTALIQVGHASQHFASALGTLKLNPLGGAVMVNDERVVTVGGGSNNNGRYVRFSDGTQICWIHIVRTDIAINNAYGSLFTSNWTWTFPASFIERPTVPTPTMRWGTSGSWGTAARSTTTVVQLFILDAFERPAGYDVLINAIAIGRWK